MGKNITNIKDLVIKIMTNGKEIESKAEKGDSESCFQMGMSHLLGLNSAIDFEKAAQYFGDKSLADDPDANRLLGFIAECEGKFGVAFQYYAKVGKSTRSYLQKVYEERGNLQSYLKKLNIPDTFLNKEITTILYEYIKGGSPVMSKMKIAYICEDEQTFLSEIQALVDSGDLFSAKRWLHIGNVAVENPLFATIEKNLMETIKGQSFSENLDVINIDGNSLISNIETNNSDERIRGICDETATLCKKEWHEKISQITSLIIKDRENEEAEYRRKEAERRKKEEERKKREEERKNKEERERKLREEKARKKKEDEKKAIEELQRKQKQKVRILDILMICLFVAIFIFCFSMWAHMDWEPSDSKETKMETLFMMIAFFEGPLFLIWVVIRLNVKQNVNKKHK